MIEFVETDKKKRRKETDVLVEKYRPLSVKTMILPDSLRLYFNNIIEEGNIPNLILYSSNPGSGKTTIAKALANDCGYDYIYINTSMDRGIDTLRTRIASYASTRSVTGKKKLIILDEFDWASPTLQAGLRGAIEEYYDKCRFIITANDYGKIIDPIKSRCQNKNFEFNGEGVKDKIIPNICKKLIGIAKREEIEYKPNTIKSIAEAYYPDIRKMIQIVDEYRRETGVIDDNIFNLDTIDDELSKLIVNCKLKSAREYILNNNYKFDMLYRYLFDSVVPNLANDIKGEAIISIAEYMDMSTRSIDQEITFVACMVSIMDLIRGDN